MKEMRAKDLKPGDEYSRKGRTHRARTVRKVGAWLLVEYDYQVADEVRGKDVVRWYRQTIPPVEKIHVNTKLTLEYRDTRPILTNW